MKQRTTTPPVAPGHGGEDDLFEVPGITFNKLPVNALKVWRIGCVLRNASLLLLIVAGMLLVPLFWTVPHWRWFWALAVLVVLWCPWRLFVLRAGWVFGGWATGENDLYIRRGVRWRSLVRLPYERIQVVSVESGPLQRRFGLANLEIKTGGYYATSVDDIDPAVAGTLRDQLMDLARERGKESGV